MRNLLGAIASVLLGSYLSFMLIEGNVLPYSSPSDALWFLIAGGTILNSAVTGIFQPNFIIPYIGIWLIMGLISGVFSISKSNTVRTALWIAVIIAILSILSAFLQNPSIWFGDMLERNSFLLAQFVQAIPTSLLSLPSAIPMVYVKQVLFSEGEPKPPNEIRTRCECGAVYKSKPMLCAECGRELHDPDSESPKQQQV
ncbi:MAG: hypothetical protein R6V83_04830 [Candidatus Thorarchaeota archaeon]